MNTCSHRCEGDPHDECPDPSVVCGIVNCTNEKYPDDEYCGQCSYELAADAAMDNAIDDARMDA